MTNATQSEREFVAGAIAAVAERVAASRSRTLFLSREVASGRRIADAVFVATRSAPWPDAISLMQSSVLAAVKNAKRADIATLARLTSLSSGDLEKILISLVRLKLLAKQLSEHGPETYRYLAPPAKIISIEAKLHKWRAALVQALDHRSYADHSYVLLPEHLAEPAIENSKQFRDAGVGLLVATKNGVKRSVMPSKRGLFDWRREFVLSRVVRGENEYRR